MIVFTYQVPSVKACHHVLQHMELPGEARETELSPEKKEATIVWRGDKFLALFYKEEQMLELYPTKNTNSINFFINRYPKLDWDNWKLVRTKRW